MNEAETRAELIDQLLTAAGWGLVEGSRIRREFPITQGWIHQDHTALWRRGIGSSPSHSCSALLMVCTNFGIV
jgi:hypothetical protein